MKKTFLYIALFLMAAMVGCSSEEKQSETDLPEGTRKLEVVEHMNGGGYTFIKGNENGNELWVAVREMPVEEGDIYYFSGSMVMSDFESKSLNKTFESILFVDQISKNPPSAEESGKEGEMPAMAGSQMGHGKPEVKEVSGINITSLSDGMTVADVYKNKSSLSGKSVKIKGKVTKYNGGIMKRNWIHIQDGTNHEGNADITVTSDQEAKVGDIIIIEGTLTVDKDFGAGYFYDVIIENAKVTQETKI